LDINSPGAAQWLGDLFKRVVNDWGYDFIKIDFVEWSLLAADRYSDPNVNQSRHLPARGRKSCERRWARTGICWIAVRAIFRWA